jgi:hypothetical protein
MYPAYKTHCLQATYVTKERANIFNCKQYKLSLAVYTHYLPGVANKKGEG